MQSCLQNTVLKESRLNPSSHHKKLVSCLKVSLFNTLPCDKKAILPHPSHVWQTPGAYFYTSIFHESRKMILLYFHIFFYNFILILRLPMFFCGVRLVAECLGTSLNSGPGEMPILIGHARGDDFIRMHHSETVFAAYAGPARPRIRHRNIKRQNLIQKIRREDPNFIVPIFI